MTEFIVNINIGKCSVSDMRKKLAGVLSKLPGDSNVAHWNFVLRLELNDKEQDSIGLRSFNGRSLG